MEAFSPRVVPKPRGGHFVVNYPAEPDMRGFDNGEAMVNPNNNMMCTLHADFEGWPIQSR